MAIILPFIEALVPMLPLIAIISFSIASLGSIYGSVMGSVLGILLSILGSSIGMFSVLSWIRDLIGNWFREKLKTREKIVKAIEWMENRSNSFMILFLSNPYIPTSIFNYAMALTGYSEKKFFLILINRNFFFYLFRSFGEIFLCW